MAEPGEIVYSADGSVTIGAPIATTGAGSDLGRTEPKGK